MASHKPTKDEPRVLLLSAPWPNYRSPSIQIAALKAFLMANGVAARADHFFLRVAAWLERIDTLRSGRPAWGTGIRTGLGGPAATFSVEETVPELVDTLIAQQGTPGLRFIDRHGKTVPW